MYDKAVTRPECHTIWNQGTIPRVSRANDIMSNVIMPGEEMHITALLIFLALALRPLTSMSDRFQEQEWGEPVDGVQCRLRLADNSTGAVPLLLFDVRNNGNRDFLVWQTPECNFAVRVDDQWYRSKFCDAKSSWFPLGRSYTGIALDLSRPNWGIDCKPGVHAIQIAVSTWVTPPSSGKGVTALSKVLSVTFSKREE